MGPSDLRFAPQDQTEGPLHGGFDLIELVIWFVSLFVMRVFQSLIGLNMEDLATVGSGAMGPMNLRSVRQAQTEGHELEDHGTVGPGAPGPRDLHCMGHLQLLLLARLRPFTLRATRRNSPRGDQGPLDPWTCGLPVEIELKGLFTVGVGLIELATWFISASLCASSCFSLDSTWRIPLQWDQGPWGP